MEVVTVAMVAAVRTEAAMRAAIWVEEGKGTAAAAATDLVAVEMGAVEAAAAAVRAMAAAMARAALVRVEGVDTAQVMAAATAVVVVPQAVAMVPVAVDSAEAGQRSKHLRTRGRAAIPFSLVGSKQSKKRRCYCRRPRATPRAIFLPFSRERRCSALSLRVQTCTTSGYSKITNGVNSV